LTNSSDEEHGGTVTAALPDIEIKDGFIHIRNPQPTIGGAFREFTFDLKQIQGLDQPAILETDESQENERGKEEADGKAEG
jgi:hypothetical protein